MSRVVAALLDQHPDIGAVVDIGAGDGELLTGLAAIRPELDLTGVELRARPDALHPAVTWIRGHWDVQLHRWCGPAAGLLRTLDRPTLVMASEWLDDLPSVVAQRVGGHWHEVLVDDAGREVAGPPLGDDQLDWLNRWWPRGQRAEVGLTRDRAWAELVAAVQPAAGMVLMIDYGHDAAERPASGSLAAYREGHRVTPRPSWEVNLTAHVAVDAVRAAGHERGARTLQYARQREAIRELAPTWPSRDPLADLSQRSQLAALGSASGLGAHWWLLQR